MERNRAAVRPDNWKTVLPAYWLEREVANAPGHWGNYLFPEYRFEQRLITKEDSVEIQKRFFDWKRRRRMNGKGPDPRKIQ